MAVGIVYVNPKGVRVQEMESFFEVFQSDVAVFEGKGYEVILMGDFNARIRLCEEAHPNSNGRRLLHLVCVRELAIGNEMKNCKEKWTWEVNKKNVFDYLFFERVGGREDGN